MDPENVGAFESAVSGVDALCPACGYNLRDAKNSQCPECGARLRIADPGLILVSKRERHRLWLAWVSQFLGVVAIIVSVYVSLMMFYSDAMMQVVGYSLWILLPYSLVTFFVNLTVSTLARTNRTMRTVQWVRVMIWSSVLTWIVLLVGWLLVAIERSAY